MLRRLALVAVLGACGQSGTLAIELVLPGGQLPDGTTQARVKVGADVMATVAVGSDGSFSLSLEFDSMSASLPVEVDLLDAAGTTLARGHSTPLPLDATSDRVKVFVAPPGRFSPAPFDFPARSDVALAPLSYGVLLAGGRNADGTKAADLAIYSVTRQTFTAGAALPSPRAGMLAVGTSADSVLFFGGLGTGEAATSDFWFFDTTVPPGGTYATLPTVPALARAGAQAAPLGNDRFIVTGDPPVLLDAVAGTVTAFTNAPDGAGQATAAATTALGGAAVVLLAGTSGIFRYDAAADSWTTLDGAARAGAAAVTMSDGRVLVAAGGTTTLISPDGTLTPGPTIGFRDRPGAAAAGTSVVVAGGFTADGTGRADADVIAGDPLAVQTVPLATPRGGAAALALPNLTILVVGGRDRDGGTPQAGAEIFTP